MAVEGMDVALASTMVLMHLTGTAVMVGAVAVVVTAATEPDGCLSR